MHTHINSVIAVHVAATAEHDYRRTMQWVMFVSLFLSQSLAVNDPGRRWVCFPTVDDPDHMGAAVRPDHSVTVVNHPADQSAGQAGGVTRRSDCNHAVMGRYTTEILSRSKTTNEISLELPFPLAIVILKGVLAD